MGAFIEHGPSADTSRQVADETLRKLGRLRAASDFELCQWFLCGFRLKVHGLYGFASFREYAERWFGCSGRATEERVRVAVRLDELPKLSAAFAAGELVYSAVRELTRVADAETEAEWLEALRGVSVGGCVREELAEYGDSSSRGPTPTWVPPPERHQLGRRDEIDGSRVSLAYPLM